MALIKFERIVKVGASVGDRFVGRFPVESVEELPKKVDHARRVGKAYSTERDTTLTFSLERKIVLPIFGPFTYRRELLGTGDAGLSKAQEAFDRIRKARTKKSE